MQEIWQRFLAVLATYSPDLVVSLSLGTNEEALMRAEHLLEVALPEEVKTFFRLQNGSEGPLFGSWQLLSLEEACQDWLTLKEQPHDVSPYSWDASWLPLLRTHGNVRIYIRLDPREEDQEDDNDALLEEEVRLAPAIPRARLGTLFLSGLQPSFVAASIQELVESLIQALEQGCYAYDSQRNRLRTVTFGSPLPPLNELEFFELIDEENEARKTAAQRRIAYPGLACISYQRDYRDPSDPALGHSIAQSWHLLRSFIEQFAPAIGRDLQKGATSEEMQHAEQVMQVHLPEEVKAWYAFCNGTRETGDVANGVFDLWDWYSLKSLQWRWEREQEQRSGPQPISPTFLARVDPRIQSVWWHPQWLPFMAHEDGSLLCLDLAPTAQGEQGQVILLIYQSCLYASSLDRTAIPPVVWVAPNLRLFLATLARDVEVGKYTFDEDTNMFWSQEGLAYIEDEEDEHFRYSLLACRRERMQQEKTDGDPDKGVFPM